MFCATWPRRHCDGMEKSPLSSCRVPLMRPDRVDLPAPLRPTRPIFSPGLRVTDTLSSRTFALRRSVRFFSRIIGSAQLQFVAAEFHAQRLDDDAFRTVFDVARYQG